MSSPLTSNHVAQAMMRLRGVVHHTPVLTSQALNQEVGAQIFFKCENFQRVGAFKFRGAYNAIAQLTAEQKQKGVATHSSGNHAQGVALAAALQGVRAVVVMPPDAPAIKRAATAAYGAEIVTVPAVEREKTSAALAHDHGYTLIHPYDNPAVIAGQGPAAWEFFEQVGPLDELLVPVGGGGLISGAALATAALCPTCRVVGVEPATGDDAGRSWRAGEIIALEHVPQTIADGARTRFIGHHNLAVMRQYVADMTVATDDEIRLALNWLWGRLKIVVEPTAALPLAALLAGRVVHGRRVGVLLSGGNVDLAAG